MTYDDHMAPMTSLKTKSFFENIAFQGRHQLREIGGAKLKSGGQRFSPKCEGRNHKFSDQKVFAEKKKVTRKKKEKKRSSPKSEGFFWPKSQILTFFSPKNTNFFLPKKYRGGGKKKIGVQERKSGGALPSLPPAGDAPVALTSL